MADINDKRLGPEGLAELWSRIKQYFPQKTDIPEFYFNTTAGWAVDGRGVSKLNAVYIWTDHLQDEHGNDVPGVKIGDGLAYIIDLPFLDAVVMEHVNDGTIHITQAEREFWNNKVRCYYSASIDDMLVFTTQ